MLRVSPTAVRRLAIRNQRLAGPAPRGRPDKAALLDTVRALRCLQLDPTPIVARSHLLVLFSRHGAFDERLVAELTYADKALFEYWAHEASFVLAEDLELHRYGMRRRPHGPPWYDEQAPFRARILEQLAADGPLPVRSIEDHATRPWESTGGWTHGRTVARMLDFMWVRGQVGIAGREGNARLWDLMERCLPADAPDALLADPEVTRRAAPLAVKALGAARPPHITKHFTRGRYPGLKAVLGRLEAEGTLVRIGVEGLGDDWWVHGEDVAALERPQDFKARTVLLSPFDNLLCDRDRTERLFGFRHRLEIYVPKPQRRWGFFVLPILDGDRLVARADLAVDRRTETLIAHVVHAEPRLPRGARLPRAIRRELERLAAWRGATRIEVRDAPDAWRPILAA